MDVQTYMHGVGRNARAASRVVAKSDTGVKNRALQAIAQAVTPATSKALGPAASTARRSTA
jgi:glutamate-5-semialdehyde dehydrogenase